jgi:DNA-binding CsgD family transcriptional regulator
MWSDAYRSLTSSESLDAEDLERLATAAYMLGREDEYLDALERAHHAHLEAGTTQRAVRCAFWLSMTQLMRGERGRSEGWYARAERLLEREGDECVERGYLLLRDVVTRHVTGDHDAALASAAEAAAIAERFEDADLHALAVHEQGLCLIRLGRVEEGLRMLDEAMVAAVGSELSPIVTGLVYCSVIDGCQEIYAVHRAQEWTAALSRWCEEQSDMVAFTGRCLVHRAEILQMHGAWENALDEARRAGERLTRAAGQAAYRRGELHRLRGELAEAEDAYREANRHGSEPQPGLALLRLAQGGGDAALAAMRRALAETADPVARIRLLPAAVEIMLATNAHDEARAACDELARLEPRFASVLLAALAAGTRGAVDLAAGDPGAALAALRRAERAWDDIGAPYERARVRVLIGLACRALGDADSAALELESAHDAFVELHAGPDATRVDELLSRATAAHGLTPRELEVLRLVAAGETNRAIAATLVLSERTVDRHLSNIFVKLGLSSRTAAAAYAYRHELV